jgi:hypothetical protein
MTNNPHKEFRIMFQEDFDAVQNAEFRYSSCTEECDSLYELIKYIFHNSDNIDVKNNITWAMNKCGNNEFLHDLKKSINSELYSEVKLRTSKS